MTAYMLIGFLLAISSVIILIISVKFKEVKKIQAIAIFSAVYALLFYILALATNDPLDIPIEVTTVITALPFTAILTKLTNDIWNMTKKFPVMESKIDNIEKSTNKISEIDGRLATHMAVCSERHRKK